jgi:DNA repair protein RadC
MPRRCSEDAPARAANLIPTSAALKKAAEPLGVIVHDHLIIGRGRHTSLRDLGLL